MSSTFTFVFMSYSNYNPGWRCLDSNLSHTELGLGLAGNHTANQSYTLDGYNVPGYSGNSSNVNNMTIIEYVQDNCAVFDSCNLIEFNPESSTIVTEWGLLCSRGWVSSLLISVQMSGVLVGCSIAGFMADVFGRKTMLYSSQIFTAILNAVAAFSVSWQMFAVMRFLLGISISFHVTLYFVYVVEFLTKRWRGIIPIMPWYPFIAVLCGIMCWVLKDWRQIHIATAVVSAVGLVSGVWAPESMRWLEVKNKTAQFEKTVKKIAKFNGKNIIETDVMLTPIQALSEESCTVVDKKGGKFRDALRPFGKEYRKFTIVISLSCFSMGVIYYAIGFGVKALSGNFYMNLILLYGSELVLDCGIMFAPNVFGRRKSGAVFAGFSGVCLLSAACLHKFSTGSIRVYGVVGCVMLGSVLINGFWCVMLMFIVELYPTVIRGVATSWGGTLIRLGGILSPSLIPNDDSTFFACYVCMAMLGFVCATLIVFLPETKGRPLEDRLKNEEDVQS